MKPLDIQALPRGESSDSTNLTKSFIEAAKADNASQSKLSSRRNILMFNKAVGRGFRSGPQRRSQSQLLEAERLSAIGRMACSISHDMRHLLSAHLCQRRIPRAPRYMCERAGRYGARHSRSGARDDGAH